MLIWRKLTIQTRLFIHGHADVRQELRRKINMAASDQDNIDIRAMFEGHIATTWRHAQEIANNLTPNCRRTGKIWTKRLVQCLYKITRAMWKQRYDTLFRGKTAATLIKRRKTILHYVKLHIKIGCLQIVLETKAGTWSVRITPLSRNGGRRY